MLDMNELGSPNDRLIYRDESYAIVGAALDVYYRLGCGFLEPVYQEALEIELGFREIPFTPQQVLPIKYKDITLKKFYKSDVVCFDKIIVEINATSALSPVDWAQLLNYMKASGFRVGLRFNFGSHGRLEYKRLVT